MGGGVVYARKFVLCMLALLVSLGGLLIPVTPESQATPIVEPAATAEAIDKISSKAQATPGTTPAGDKTPAAKLNDTVDLPAETPTAVSEDTEVEQAAQSKPSVAYDQDAQSSEQSEQRSESASSDTSVLNISPLDEGVPPGTGTLPTFLATGTKWTSTGVTIDSNGNPTFTYEFGVTYQNNDRTVANTPKNIRAWHQIVIGSDHTTTLEISCTPSNQTNRPASPIGVCPSGFPKTVNITNGEAGQSFDTFKEIIPELPAHAYRPNVTFTVKGRTHMKPGPDSCSGAPRDVTFNGQGHVSFTGFEAENIQASSASVGGTITGDTCPSGAVVMTNDTNLPSKDSTNPAALTVRSGEDRILRATWKNISASAVELPIEYRYLMDTVGAEATVSWTCTSTIDGNPGGACPALPQSSGRTIVSTAHEDGELVFGGNARLERGQEVAFDVTFNSSLANCDSQLGVQTFARRGVWPTESDPVRTSMPGPPMKVVGCDAHWLINEPFNGMSVDPVWKGLNDACLTRAPRDPSTVTQDGTLGSCRHGRYSDSRDVTVNYQNIGVPAPDFVDDEGNARGFLQLTDDSTEKVGAVLYNRAFPAKNGLVIEFTQYQYGVAPIGAGADGIGFFLADGAYTLDKAGPRGGYLGYATGGTGTAIAPLVPGLNHGYLGVGFDVYGNFGSTSDITAVNCIPAESRKALEFKNSVTLRGPGHEFEGYCAVGSSERLGSDSLRASRGGNAIEDLQEAVKESARNTRVTVYPVAAGSNEGPRVTVEIDFGSGFRQVLDRKMDQPVPELVKFGFLGATGGQKDSHLLGLVRVGTVRPLAKLNLQKSLDVERIPAVNPGKSATRQAFSIGETVPYEFVVDNTGTATISDITVTDPHISNINCGNGNVIPQIEGGGQAVCRGDYVVQEADRAGLTFRNTATVKAPNPEMGPPELVEEDDEIVPINPTAADDTRKIRQSTADRPSVASFQLVKEGNNAGLVLPDDPSRITVQLVDPVTEEPTDATSIVVPGQGTWTLDSATNRVTFEPLEGFDNVVTPLTYQANVEPEFGVNGIAGFARGSLKVTISDDGFAVQKLAEDGTTKLEGAVFQLYPDNGNGRPDKSKPLGPLGQVSGKPGLSSIGIDPGRTYWLRETRAPDGYDVLRQDIRIVVAANGTVTAPSAPSLIDVVREADGGYVINFSDLKSIPQPQLTCSPTERAHTQSKWRLGGGRGLDFPVGATGGVGEGQAVTALPNDAAATLGKYTVTDATGRLIFWVNGRNGKVYNHDGREIGSVGSKSNGTQNVTVVPAGEESGRFYIISNDAAGTGGTATGQLQWALLDMNLNAGRGTLTAGSTFGTADASGGMASVPNSDGTGWWVVAPNKNGDAIQAHLFTKDGYQSSVSSLEGTGSGIAASGVSGYTSIAFSADLQYAATSQSHNAGGTRGKLRLLRFNAETGEFTLVETPYALSGAAWNNLYNVEFSPEGDWLYFTRVHSGAQFSRIRINQMDFDGAPETIQTNGNQGGAVHRGPDGRMYVASNTNSVHVINDPDAENISISALALAANSGHMLSQTLPDCVTMPTPTPPAQTCTPDEGRATERWWAFGNKAMIDWGRSGTDTRKLVSGSPMNTQEGSTTVTDSRGNLLFYSNGDTIWNRKNQVMVSGLTAYNSAVQTVASFPAVGKPGHYFVIHNNSAGDVLNRAWGNLYFTEIDMNLNGGLGGQAEGTPKETELPGVRASEAMTAFPNAAGDGYWVVTFNDTEIVAYEFDGNGPKPGGPAVTSLPESTAPLPTNANRSPKYGSLRLSPDGMRMLLADRTGLQILTVDAENGTFTQEYKWAASGLGSASHAYFADWSPEGNYVYHSFFGNASNVRLYRYKVAGASSSQEIAASQERINSMPALLGQVVRAPDGKMYVGNQREGDGYRFMGVIGTPEAETVAGADYHVMDLNPIGAKTRLGFAQTVVGCHPNDPELAIEKSVAPLQPDGWLGGTEGSVAKNQTVEYAVVVTNSGQGPAYDVTVSDDLSKVLDDATWVAGSESATFSGAALSSADGTLTYVEADKKLTWSGLLQANETLTITYQVQTGNPSTGDRKLVNKACLLDDENKPFQLVAGGKSCASTETSMPPSVLLEKRAFSTDSAYPLDGAEFVVVTDDNGQASDVQATGVTVSALSGQQGKYIVDGMVPSRPYWLKETKSPKGFTPLAAPVRFVMSAHGSVTVNDSLVAYTCAENQPCSIKVANEKASGLPSSGGTGSWALIVLGIVLTGVSVAVGMRRRTGKRV